MLRYLCWLAGLSVVALTIGILLLKTIGTFRPVQPVMMGLDQGCESKQQPCWYGVTLGETSAKDVQAIFGALGDSVTDNAEIGQLEIYKTTLGGCFAQFIYGRGGSTIINAIILNNCSRLRLGDLLARYGEPESLGTTISCDATHPFIQHDGYFIEYPADGIIAAINRPAILIPWLSLQGKVTKLYLAKPHQTDGRKTWAGIVSFERFVRLHPEQIRNNGCGP